MKRLMLFAIPLMLIFGCTNWEQTTYKMLAASQAVINQAQAITSSIDASPLRSCSRANAATAAIIGLGPQA